MRGARVWNRSAMNGLERLKVGGSHRRLRGARR